VVLPPGAFEDDQHGRLRQHERAKADVSPLFAEKFPEFVDELSAEHSQW
jgi:hypothetical protein